MEVIIFLCLLHIVRAFQDGGVVPAASNTTRSTSDTTQPRWRLTDESLLLYLKETGRCGLESQAVLQGAAKMEISALKILDATAKFPSGVLNGNLNQYGDFDECLSVNTAVMKGKYCLANIDIRLTGLSLRPVDALVHSHWSMRSTLQDPGHRIPKLGSFNWGICVPSSCSRHHVETALNAMLGNLTYPGQVEATAAIDDEMCYVKEKPAFTLTNYLALGFFTTILLLAISGTYVTEMPSKWKQYLECFSLRRNLKSLLDTKPVQDDIPVFHGARALNALGLLLSHKQIAQMFNPIVNRTEMSEMLDGTWSMIGRSAMIYTDSFIFMSGLLVAYSLVKELDAGQKLNIRQKYLVRFWRFVPNLAAIILFCTYLLPHLGSGPQWGLVIDRYANLCKTHMWKNFLFIHNLFGFEEMCLTHTHQVGIDMQLFLASPFFIYLLWRFPRLGTASLLGVAAGSTLLRYQVTLEKELSTVVHYGITVERLFKTARYSYILPTHRATVYAIGLWFGYYLRRGGANLTFSKTTLLFGWIFGVVLGVLAMFGPYHMALKNYTYNAMDAAVYNALSPISWCAFLCWCLLACVNGRGGFFNHALSANVFMIFSKIAYAVYLTQFPIFFYNVGTQRSPMYYSGLQSLFDWNEIGLIFGSSLALTLLFDMPFQNLRRVLLHRKEQEEQKMEEDEKEDAVTEEKNEELRLSVSIRRRTAHG